MEVKTFTETVHVSELKPHHRNYRSHPEDQLEHISASIQKHGLYRNVVIARDGTILAGHGVVEAARRVGIEDIPVYRYDIDPESVEAIEVLTGDNEVDHLGMVDDRALTELLKEINDVDTLLGTGYDQQMLANLTFVTRPASEIKDHDEAAHWVGLPDYEPQQEPYKITINFDTEEDRQEFADAHSIEFIKARDGAVVWSTRYPYEGLQDPSSLRFE